MNEEWLEGMALIFFMHLLLSQINFICFVHRFPRLQKNNMKATIGSRMSEAWKFALRSKYPRRLGTDYPRLQGPRKLPSGGPIAGRFRCSSPLKQLNCLLNGQKRAYTAAVLGGGITGLTSTWQLAQDPECERVVLYEKSNRLGGWIDSETIPVEGGNVVFEYGPRTLRSSVPESLPLLSLASALGLHEDLILTPKSSPAAQNRYVYYPDRLVRIPTPKSTLSLVENIENLVNTLKEPLFDKVVSGIVKDVFTPPRHPSEWAKDESVADFIGRRFGPNVAENLVSAVLHGIYAGDIDQLSAQTLMGGVRNLEGGIGGIGGFVSGGVTGSMISRAISKIKTRSMDDFMVPLAMAKSSESKERMRDLHSHVSNASTFTFKRGVGQLAEALGASLRASDKVEIMINTQIKGLSAQRGGSKISLSTKEPNKETDTWCDFDHVISTIPPVALAETMRSFDTLGSKPPGLTPSLLRQQNYAVTVMVVNLYYPNPDLLPVEEGFGYLIPRSIPYEQNPECGLGVIFASSSSVGKGTDPSSPTLKQDSAPGTKLTIMLGGHYWDGFQEYPDHDKAVKMACDMLKRHLNITDTLTVARTRLQKNAIPQYTVGHLNRMYRLSKAAREEYNGSLVLAGNWYNGVGVGDCVKQGILSATYGIGRCELSGEFGAEHPWTAYDYEDWPLKGGVTMAPVRLVDSEH
ncbi:hypothetical protein N7457_007879 [Penicillium paradoxum]|uniref:uncharacterized protein n=1 Tax=Penicillium paradoxum TaxID=176176 RepID=UPI0025481083|nr:uncharacterized protein N7457_007879 [Penicillium paradoxum]KAJ5772983.1 hypothetical protein N7457_007879 [Penicillium paradoxum]